MSKLDVPGPSVEAVERALTPPDASGYEITDEMRGVPLTPAEKQKAYRERDSERKREMNRLRMRKKRDEQM